MMTKTPYYYYLGAAINYSKPFIMLHRSRPFSISFSRDGLYRRLTERCTLTTEWFECMEWPIGTNVEQCGCHVCSFFKSCFRDLTESSWSLAKDLYGFKGPYWIVPMSLLLGMIPTCVQWLLWKVGDPLFRTVRRVRLSTLQRWRKIGPIPLDKVVLPIIYMVYRHSSLTIASIDFFDSTRLGCLWV